MHLLKFNIRRLIADTPDPMKPVLQNLRNLDSHPLIQASESTRLNFDGNHDRIEINRFPSVRICKSAESILNRTLQLLLSDIAVFK